MVCTVLRPFGGADGRTYQIGEEVDSTAWRNETSLVSGRYLQPVAFADRKKRKEEPPTAAPVPVRRKNERIAR